MDFLSKILSAPISQKKIKQRQILKINRSTDRRAVTVKAFLSNEPTIDIFLPPFVEEKGRPHNRYTQTKEEDSTKQTTSKIVASHGSQY
jgi:hypothetical protein